MKNIDIIEAVTEPTDWYAPMFSVATKRKGIKTRSSMSQNECVTIEFYGVTLI